VNNHVLQNAVIAAVLDVDRRGRAGVETLHGSGQDLQGQSQVKHLDGLKL
jgi:hypothetical protein